MMREAINSLGFVEVRGLAAAIETADAMLKSAEVRLIRQLHRDPANITITVEGSLGACRAAVDAGSDCAKRLGSLVAAHVMGRPADDTADFVLSLADAGRLPFGEPGCGAGAAEKKPALPSGEPADEQLLAAIEDTPGGIGVQALARLLDAPVDRVRERLEALASLGLVVRRRGRYVRGGTEGRSK